jgi:hypothetical protein
MKYGQAPCAALASAISGTCPNGGLTKADFRAIKPRLEPA